MLKKELKKALFLMFLGSVAIGGAKAAPKTDSGSFREITRFPLGGDGGWDYLTVDADARRLYIARSDRVMVVDPDSGKLLGEVKGLEGAHGIALVKGLDLGFATSGKSGEVVVFGLKDLKVTKRIPAGENPDAVVYEPNSKRIFAFNGKSHSVTAIDVATLKAVGTVALEGKPEFAVSDGAGKVFFNLEDKGVVLGLDPSSLKVTTSYALKPCEEPTGLSIDSASHRLIVGCGNALAAILDAGTGKILQTFKVGDGVDATAFDPERKLAFVSAGEGRLTILNEDATSFHLLQDVPTVKSARTIAFDAKTGRAFLPIARFKPQTSEEKKAGHARPAVVPGSFAVLVVGEK